MIKTKDKRTRPERERGIFTHADGTRDVNLTAAVKRQKAAKKFEAYKRIRADQAA